MMRASRASSVAILALVWGLSLAAFTRSPDVRGIRTVTKDRRRRAHEQRRRRRRRIGYHLLDPDLPLAPTPAPPK